MTSQTTSTASNSLIEYHTLQETLQHLEGNRRGIVYRKSTGSYAVRTPEGDTITCTITNRLRKVLVYPPRDPSSLGYFKVDHVEDIRVVDPVAVGDEVAWVEMNPGEGMIKEVLPRRSKLTRRAAGTKPTEQVIVANADQLVAVMAVKPDPQWTLLDRYLAGAEASEMPAIICLTKLDLIRGTPMEAEVLVQVEVFRNIGYQVITTSTTTGEGIETLREVLKGKMSVFIGKSGVGKSSLLNTLQPGLGIRVNEINLSYGKGRHTTTYLEMHTLESGGEVVDTPGVKVYGLWNVDPDDIDLMYRDFAPFVGKCKFGADCTHEHEPGCAIIRAVQQGKITKRRYESYRHVRRYFDQEDK